MAWVGLVQGCILHSLAGVAVVRLEIRVDEGSKVKGVPSELNVYCVYARICAFQPLILGGIKDRSSIHIPHC